MKVLHVIPAIAPRYGGPSQLVLDMCRALNESGVEAHIATTNADGLGVLDVPLKRFTNYNGVDCIFFKKNFSEAYKFSNGLAVWLGAHVSDYDVVHIHAVFSHSTWSAGRACQRANIPYIIRPLGSLDPWSMQRRSRLKGLLLTMGLRDILLRAKAIHYTTLLEKDKAESLLSLNNGVVIPNAITRAEQSEGKPEYEDYILYLGRLHEKKKLPELIEGFGTWKKDHPDQETKLILAGDGEDSYVDRLKSGIAYFGLTEDVILQGWVEGAEKQSLIKHAKLMVLISENENYGISIVESMAAGVPVLVNKGVYLYPDISEAHAGWVSDERNTISDKLKEALMDSEKRAEFGKNAKKLVEENFYWERVTNRVKDLYENLQADKVRAKSS